MNSAYNSGNKFTNNDINQHLSDASLNAEMNSIEFSRLVINLTSALEFSKEVDAADTRSLLIKFE